MVESASGDRRRLRVLFLDDDEGTVRALKRALADEVEIIGATTAAEAIEILASGVHLDAAIFDIMGVAGYSVAAKARELRPDLPIAMLSGSREAEDINPAALAKPPIPFLAKPLSAADALAWIHGATARETPHERQLRIAAEFCREKQLTERHRDVLVRRLEHKSTHQIACDLGITTGRVSMLEHEVRGRLGVESIGTVLRHLVSLGLVLLGSACGGEREVLDAGSDGQLLDADGDGHDSTDSGGDDCNDSDPAIHPGVTEDEAWAVEILDPVGAEDSLVAIAVTDAQPAVCVPRGGDIRVLQRVGRAWRDDLLDVGALYLLRLGLALDADGTAHVTFTPNATGVWYSTNADGSWSAASEVTNGGLALGENIAIDVDGRVLLGFVDSEAHEGLAVLDGPEWRVETLPFDTCGLGSAMGVSGDRSVHFVWMTGCGSPTDLAGTPIHATNATGAWTTEPITTDLFGWASLTVSASGEPVAALAAREQKVVPMPDIHEAEPSAGRWEAASVGAGIFPSIVIDSLWDPHIVTANTHYFRAEDGAWQSETYTDEDVYMARIVSSVAGLHVAFLSRSGALGYAHLSPQDRIDNDCDGGAW